jgi:Hint domain
VTVHIQSANITSISTDSGSSATDFYTNDQTLIVSGTVTTNGGGGADYLAIWATQGTTHVYLGQATVTATGTWTLTTGTGGTIPAGAYTLQAFEVTNGTTTYPSGSALASHALTIDITNPTETVPGTQTDPLSGGGNVVFSTAHSNALTVGDNNTDTLTVALGVQHGTLTLSGNAGLTFVAGSNGGAAFTISGTATAINAALNGMSYHTTSTNTQVGNIDDKLSIQVTDQAGNQSTPANVNIDVTCFMAGTLIRTPNGEVAVEVLKRGDLVVTSDGRSLPVSWLGRQTVSTIFSDKLRVLPIRIKAGALSESVPARDLLVSPDHAILVEGALIQAGALINGSSIVRERNVPTVFTYYHVEVDDHALILAENTPAETFIDNVDRLGFDNWAEHQVLYPEGKPISELPYPRAKAHRQVPVNIRVKLAERAQLIGAVVDSAAVA